MYKKKSVSVVFATYKEKDSIRKVVQGFEKTGFVDEIIVVDNNAEKGTDEEVKKTKARIVYEPRQGYGYAFQTALLEAKSDYIVVCEPDGSFSGSDLEKFLLFAEDFDVVFGSRTSLIPSLSFAGMGVTRKFANVIEAKTIEVLFNTNALTDVGCAYKLFKRSALEKIKTFWRHTSPLFNTELMLLTISNKIKFVEIPVRYQKRVGKSSIVNTWPKVLKWALFIQIYILAYWFYYRLLSNKRVVKA